MKIVFIGTVIPPERNRTRFQRALMLTENHDVYFVLRTEICQDINIRCKESFVLGKKILNLDRLVFPIWAVWKSYLIIKRNHIDIIYSSRNDTSIIIGYLIKQQNIKWVVDIWDDIRLEVDNLKQYDEIKYRVFLYIKTILYKVSKKLLKYSDLIILALSPKFIKYLEINEVKKINITNGVDLSLIRNHKFNSTEKKKTFEIIYVGHLSENRGIKIILESANILIRYISKVKINLIGNMNKADREWLNKEIEKKNIKNCVSISGEKSHEYILKRIQRADICLCILNPKVRNYRYAYPIKIFEYMAMGKVTVATKLPGIEEIIEDNKNGILISSGNPAQLSQAILKIYFDKKLREKIEQNAMNDVRKYDWEIISRKLNAQLNKMNLAH